jgi:hypothetical protein
MKWFDVVFSWLVARSLNNAAAAQPRNLLLYCDLAVGAVAMHTY